MRYLILSDLHANLEALEKSLELAQGKYDKAVCLGDLVGYGPDPNGVVELVKQFASAVIRGNHDKACSGITDASEFNLFARLAVAWTRSTLTLENLAFLRQLPAGPEKVDRFEIVHGSEQDEDQYVLEAADAVLALKTQGLPLVFFGHTHHQGAFCLTGMGSFSAIPLNPAADGRPICLPLSDDTRYLINPGSVGQPRDGDWRAAFAIFDENAHLIEFYRTKYDLARTQSKMVAASLPDPLIHRLEFGR
jgi:predicted phosphodiesterase